jgi:hypothetical protein
MIETMQSDDVVGMLQRCTLLNNNLLRSRYPKLLGGDDNDEDGKNDEGEGEEFNTNLGDFNIQKGSNSLRCTKILS